MITVTIKRESRGGRIAAFEINGHAEYAQRGEDIVCAGVSAISVGTVNAIEALAGIILPVSMHNGWLQSRIPVMTDAATDEKLQLLLESMIVMLRTIEHSYDRHVVLHELSF